MTNTSASEQKGETLSDHFLVDDKFKFYNIGVSRSVHKKAPAKTDTKVEEATEAKEKETKNTSNNDNNTSDDDSTKSNPYGDREFKYLTCCDCERGPLGITFVDDPNNFYVSHKRIRYE